MIEVLNDLGRRCSHHIFAVVTFSVVQKQGIGHLRIRIRLRLIEVGGWRVLVIARSHAHCADVQLTHHLPIVPQGLIAVFWHRINCDRMICADRIGRPAPGVRTMADEQWSVHSCREEHKSGNRAKTTFMSDLAMCMGSSTGSCDSYRYSRLTAKCSSEIVHDRMPVILKPSGTADAASRSSRDTSERRTWVAETGSSVSRQSGSVDP